MTLCGVQLSPEPSPTTGPSHRFPNNPIETCIYPLPGLSTSEFPFLVFVANAVNSLPLLYGVLLTTAGRRWSADCVFATLYFQCLSFWVPWIIPLWTEIIDKGPPPPKHTKKTPLGVPKDKHCLTSPWIFLSILFCCSCSQRFSQRASLLRPYWGCSVPWEVSLPGIFVLLWWNSLFSLKTPSCLPRWNSLSTIWSPQILCWERMYTETRGVRMPLKFCQWCAQLSCQHPE